MLAAVIAGSCHFYHKGNEFWANHNYYCPTLYREQVVISTTKVMNFEQITTTVLLCISRRWLSFLPQREWILSKSQLPVGQLTFSNSCHFYHKGNEFWANHNARTMLLISNTVVISTTKVMNFEQITTGLTDSQRALKLSFLPQREWILSKSQLNRLSCISVAGCHFYHKDNEFWANHNN